MAFIDTPKSCDNSFWVFFSAARTSLNSVLFIVDSFGSGHVIISCTYPDKIYHNVGAVNGMEKDLNLGTNKIMVEALTMSEIALLYVRNYKK
jgi:hypothetical protein